MKGYIRSILSSSAVDGPGNRLVIFFQGCNLNCTFCHNPETIKLCNPENFQDFSTDILTLEVSEILQKINKVKPFISGVTISGGECTVQYDFLLELVKILNKEKISTYIDTNGLLSLEKMKNLCQYVDKFMLDVKSVNLNDHFKITGSENRLVLENLDFLAKENKLYEVRSVIIPNLINNEMTIRYVSEKLREYDLRVRYKLIQYRKYGVRQPFSNNYISPSSEYMIKLKEIAESYGLCNVIIT